MEYGRTLVPILAAIFAGALLVQSTVPVMVVASSSSENEWRTIKTDVVTIFFPASGRNPMFLWRYNKEPENLYVVQFDGVTEYFDFDTAYYRRAFNASDVKFKELFDEFAEEIDQGHEPMHARALFQKMLPVMELRRNLVKLRAAVDDIVKEWGHPPYFPFSESKWTLQNVANITANDGRGIGLTFTFNLSRVAKSAFKFAENNIAIRIRFYDTAVTEDVKGTGATAVYSYLVGANEMKMDFIVENWKWNLDLAQPLLERLRDNGVNVPQTRTSLALGIRLASLNRTVLDGRVLGDEDFEEFENTRGVVIEGEAVGLSKNRIDDETPIGVAKGLGEQFKVRFASDQRALAGFFKFAASALVVNSSGSYRVPVEAAYRGDGASLRLFVGYPYFSGMLVHDPSIGVETPETTAQSATTPSYRTSVDAGSAGVTARLVAPQILWTPLVVGVGVVAAVLASILVVARSRGRGVVLRAL